MLLCLWSLLQQCYYLHHKIRSVVLQRFPFIFCMKLNFNRHPSTFPASRWAQRWRFRCDYYIAGYISCYDSLCLDSEWGMTFANHVLWSIHTNCRPSLLIHPCSRPLNGSVCPTCLPMYAWHFASFYISQFLPNSRRMPWSLAVKRALSVSQSPVLQSHLTM